ncbi:UDP-glucose 4-epimerase GalE [Candidatus Saccharibacteria bacterium]|nr:MAG: UDP-glucose 4-epimerase GalE [Candidatus Saccharibacteria bacterium]
MSVLLTGGAGYIGSHTAVELVSAGHDIVIADNYSNSSPEAVRRIEKIVGSPIRTYELDVCDAEALAALFDQESIESVIHFAGLKAVGESVEQPLRYYRTNIDATLTLLEVMSAHGVDTLIFSSSATVYGTPDTLPLTEASPTGIGLTNPYGKTKYMIEQILMDASLANPDLQVSLLRYFNPVGAHHSGTIGEDPRGIPNNLFPYIAQVAVGRRERVTVFGDDYDTPDGTGVRDYIHVVDLARGHVAALEHSTPGTHIYNLGTGTGTSVLEAIRSFSDACGHEIAYTVEARRPGDIAACYANADKAAAKLDWRAEKTVADACRDTWRWQSNNPKGYQS